MEKEVVRIKLSVFPDMEYTWNSGVWSGRISFQGAQDCTLDHDELFEKRDGIYYPKDGRYDLIIVRPLESTAKGGEE